MKKIAVFIVLLFLLGFIGCANNFPSPPEWIIGNWKGEEINGYSDKTNKYKWSFSNEKIVYGKWVMESGEQGFFAPSYSDKIRKDKYVIISGQIKEDEVTFTFKKISETRIYWKELNTYLERVRN